MNHYKMLNQHEQDAIDAALDKLQLRLRGWHESTVCLVEGSARQKVKDALAVYIIECNAASIRKAG